MTLVRPIFLVDNLFSPLHYRSHIVSAEEEPAGAEANRFATLRREDHASPTTANSDWWLKVACGQPRAANMLLLWDHNLLGETLRIEVSDNDTDWQIIFNAILPTSPGAGHVDDALGVVTEDGSWLKRFPLRVGTYWRLFVPAMGADQKPEINGVLGQSYSPSQYDYPYAPSTTEFLAEEQRSDRGVLGRSAPVNLRRGAITMKMRSDFDYEAARFPIEHRWGDGAPMLVVHDASQAERAVLAVRTGGSLLGFETDTAWPDGGEGRRMGRLEWVEHDPA